MSLLTKFFSLIKPATTEFYDVTQHNSNYDIIDDALYKAALTGNITIYVSTTGNDTTGTGTSGTPYKTINKALSVIPKNLNGYSAVVNIANGTYEEDVQVKDFHGGEIILSLAAGGTVTLSRLAIKSSTIVHIVSSATANLILNSSTDIPFFIYRASNVKNAYVNITINGNAAYSGMALAEFSEYQSATSHAITVNNASSGLHVSDSKAYIYSLAGTGNTTGIRFSSGGIATIYSNTISATTPKIIEPGSKLLNDVIDVDRVSNTNTVTAEGYAADARQLNPNIVGTVASKQKITQQTLEAGNTSITISDARILADNNVFEIFVDTDHKKVNWTSFTFTTGSITIVFPVQATNMVVGVRVNG